MKVLKFALRYKFIKRETRGLELRSRPLISLYIPQSPRTLEVACDRASALHALETLSIFYLNQK